MVNRFNWFKFFFRRSTGSSGLLANGSAFGIFGALVQDGSSLSAPNGLGGWFYVRFGPFFGLIATHIESMWIIGGARSYEVMRGQLPTLGRWEINELGFQG